MDVNKYIIEKIINHSEARFTFEGKFNQQTVTWHAYLCTCKNYTLKNKPENNSVRQFIDIRPHQTNNHYYLKICLDLEKITQAEILKTTIMIRLYKNLALGRHEFG